MEWWEYLIIVFISLLILMAAIDEIKSHIDKAKRDIISYLNHHN